MILMNSSSFRYDFLRGKMKHWWGYDVSIGSREEQDGRIRLS
jgi:hypothetical protein